MSSKLLFLDISMGSRLTFIHKIHNESFQNSKLHNNYSIRSYFRFKFISRQVTREIYVSRIAQYSFYSISIKMRNKTFKTNEIKLSALGVAIST